MQFLFYYVPASQTTISRLLPSILPSPTESFRPSVSSQTNNITVGVSLTLSRDLSLTKSASEIKELSSKDGFLASSFSSFKTQNASLLISKSITLPLLLTRFAF